MDRPEFAGMNDVEIAIALWAESLSDEDRAASIRALNGTLTEEDHARIERESAANLESDDTAE
jgi:hypothetical protein